MTYKAVIFDMDGVLFDTEGFYCKRREIFLAQHGISIQHIPRSYFIGGNMKDIWHRILGDDYDLWDVEGLQSSYIDYKKKHPLPYKDLIFPDVREVLTYLQAAGYQIGLASSSVKSDILRALEENHLMEFFEVILSGEEFVETKPHPEIYETACKQLGVLPSEVLIIEDSEKGITAGVLSGAEVWAICDTRFEMDQSKAHCLVKDLTEVKKKIEEKTTCIKKK